MKKKKTSCYPTWAFYSRLVCFIWSDDRISPGANWEEEMDHAISQARVAILLISANYLSSEFILRKQVRELLQRREIEGITVFPVIAKACAWRQTDWLR